MRNTGLEKLDGLVGDWTTTISDAWFLEPPETTIPGTTTIEWLDDSFLIVRTRLGGGALAHSTMSFVIGRSDPHNRFVVLYHDDRGVCREFAMTFEGTHWTMAREDPDFHQRFIADVEADRISGRFEASDDGSGTWRKDFDITYERA